MKNILIEFWDRNSLRIDESWEKFIRKPIIFKIIDFCKWKANELILSDQTQGKFKYLKEKFNELDKLLKEVHEKELNKELLKKGHGFIRSLPLEHQEILEYLYKQWKINLLFLFFKKLSNLKEIIFEKISSPLYVIKDWKKVKIRDFHDIDHDLLKQEKNLLAYFIKTEELNYEEIEYLILVLNKRGDNLENFVKQYYNKNFIENLFNKLYGKIVTLEKIILDKNK